MLDCHSSSFWALSFSICLILPITSIIWSWTIDEFSSKYEKYKDPFHQDYYWFDGKYIYDKNNTNTDDYAVENGYMTMQDKVWWGFSDEDLFKWSKEEIKELAKENKPFNYIALTVDTHFVDGYLSPNADKKYDSQYENVHIYSSKIIWVWGSAGQG